ncbi:hypothetical protein LJB81_01135 [Desulfovibrio sp. OttesenSCG-928-M14]|nr:hypothetical protein [Desulfovibrio sp. OttesenSCG-928-M16]MDL2216319.1 hypothetical protein [Desulfovibrio sp. OttesenSCG-928-M14]
MDMSDTGTRAYEKMFLRSDNGAELFFRGRLYSEISYYDEESASLTRLRLFVTESGEQVYSIVSGAGADKTRRHYIIAQDGDFYRVSNGIQTMSLPPDLLFAAVFGLCGIDPDRAEELKPGFEENLRMIAG